MLKVGKILLPVDFHETSLGIVQLASGIARRFGSEIVLVHILSPQSYSPHEVKQGEPLRSDELLSEVVEFGEKDLHESVRKELQGLRLKCLVRRGSAADEIVAIAGEEAVDLIVMPTHGNDGFYRFLIGSVTATVINQSACPVLTEARLKEHSLPQMEVKHVLCGVTFSAHTHLTLKCAVQVAQEFKAKLTLAHVTPSVEMYGPGGNYVDHHWGDELVEGGKELLARLQQEFALQGDSAIESGNTAEGFSRIVSRTGADLLVIGAHISGGHLGSSGYDIISEVGIPVLSV